MTSSEECKADQEKLKRWWPGFPEGKCIIMSFDSTQRDFLVRAIQYYIDMPGQLPDLWELNHERGSDLIESIKTKPSAPVTIKMPTRMEWESPKRKITKSFIDDLLKLRDKLGGEAFDKEMFAVLGEI